MFAHIAELYHFEAPVRAGQRPTLRPWRAVAALFGVASSGIVWSGVPTSLVETPQVIAPRIAASISTCASLRKRRSHNGTHSAEVNAASPIAVAVTQSWPVHVAARRHRVAHAKLRVTAWMPDFGNIARANPIAHYVGHGNYRVDDVVMSRVGWSNVRLVIDSRYGTDSVAFNVVLPPSRTVAPVQRLRS